MKTIFRREIGDGIFNKCWSVAECPGVLLLEVCFKRRDALPYLTCKNGISQAGTEFVFGYILKNGNGIMIKVLPSTRREFVENLLALLVPSPPQIGG